MFRSESDFLLQLQHTSPAAASSSTRRHPQQSSDALVQMYMLLPLAGTWRVTAGWGKSTLQHIGDVVAVDCSNPQIDHVVSRSHQVGDGRALEQVVADTPVQPHVLEQVVADTPVQPRLVLPEAFGSDDDEPTAPVFPAQSESNASVFDACGDVEGAEMEHVLWLQGGAAARSGGSNGSSEAHVYTHSGERPSRHASRCSNRLWRDLTPAQAKRCPSLFSALELSQTSSKS